ncbi:MAG: energy-coupling factor transporter ATPase [Lachnospiraceae bacterium]|nr:energy-coupling factor transporter ATPase [Lachnospiraceae bacterium]
MGIVETKDLAYEYIRRDEDGNPSGIIRAVDGVSLNVKKGEFIAILGGNGSGKSTLAKHINAILYPTEGSVEVDGMNTRDPKYLWDIRQNAGMVFQNPDNQIIGNVVEEDVGFGPENMGVPTEQIWERVKEALQILGMYDYRTHSPNRLSGGQKQRVAIAGVVAMHPKCIIMDEPTAMLDPAGRKEVIRAARALNSVENVTVILITHYMEEVIYANRVFVMNQGKIALQGTPREIFTRIETLRALRLDVPQPTMLSYELRKAGLDLPESILTNEELVEALAKKLTLRGGAPGQKAGPALAQENPVSGGDSGKGAGAGREQAGSAEEDSAKEPPLLILDHVGYTYSKDTSDEIQALKDINLSIYKGEFIGLIGHTGSGKSTLVQHLNGLIEPTEGAVYFKGQDIFEKGYKRRELRSHVGLVFQYPEHQLFEETVFKDVCFGPKNMGLSDKDAELRAYEALKSVKLPDDLFYVSPFDLSGGQKRRVAIAGVLAMKPDILILDEPTAGLDPQGRDEILDLVKSLRDKNQITVVLVSHSMEDVANYVDRILCMDKGCLRMDGSPRQVFGHREELEEMGLRAPQVTYIMGDLKRSGFPVDPLITTIEEARNEILRFA